MFLTYLKTLLIPSICLRKTSELLSVVWKFPLRGTSCVTGTKLWQRHPSPTNTKQIVKWFSWSHGAQDRKSLHGQYARVAWDRRDAQHCVFFKYIVRQSTTDCYTHFWDLCKCVASSASSLSPLPVSSVSLPMRCSEIMRTTPERNAVNVLPLRCMRHTECPFVHSDYSLYYVQSPHCCVKEHPCCL